MTKDPVCGMRVLKVFSKFIRAKSEYKGKTYYFCANGCKKRFDADPTKYVEHGILISTGINRIRS